MRCEGSFGNKKACNEAATHSVTINIPAVGVPIDLHQPLKLYVDVKMCHFHAKEFSQFFSWKENDELKDNIITFMNEARCGDIDFNRSFTSVIRMTDDYFREAQNFIRKPTGVCQS